MNLDRFKPPTAQEQQEWILCEECNDAQASVTIKQTNQYVCTDCADKLKEEKEDANIPPAQ